MVVQREITIGGVTYIKTYSDADKYVERDGVKYVEAIDPVGTDRVYTESEESIHGEEISDETALKIILGRE